jgi:glycosyltransferase involved in cell wall biosynthesis
VSTNVEVLVEAVRGYLDDPGRAARDGAAARAAALERYGLERFLADWDTTLADVAAGAARTGVRA